MAELTLDSLRRDGQSFMEAVSREYHQAHAGFKATAELQPIYERYRAVLGRDALELALELFRSAPAGSEERRSARTLLEWQVESQASRVVAALDEREIAWEGSAAIRLGDGREVPYARASIEIANAADRRERLALDAARASLVEGELAPLRRERLARERDFVEGLEVAPGYVATFEALSGIELDGLAAACRAFLDETRAAWDDVLPGFLKRSLGITPAEATRADALALLRGREYDRAFPAAELEPAVRRQVAEMGIDPDAGGRVVHDLAERPGKRSRAFCAPVRVPEEVYLVLRPHGGQADYTTLLHELGHALHFAYMRPDLPFEFRWVGDNSITEAYAMLFDHRMQDRGWLLRYTGLSRSDVGAFLRHAALEELHFLRRYCAKLLYETQLYSGEVPWDALPDLYADTLTGATTFRYRRADAFVDVDPRFYAARYLRAWQLQALLAEALVARFDEDWWRNPRAGPWVVEQLFAEGQRELATELALRVGGGAGLSFAPLVRAIEGALA
ncbi:MAG: hypothetical protein ACJ79S_18485 [Gemmatimonadaceae bacterium]